MRHICKVYRLIIGAMVLLLMAGCNNTISALGPGPDIVVLWHTFAGAERAALEALGDRFDAGHPDGPTLIVEYQEEILEKLNTLPAAQQPDLVVTGADTVPQFHDRMVSLALPSSIRRDLLPMAEALYEDDGTLVAFPLGLATSVLYYNQAWVRDLGYEAETATASDLLDTACAATDMGNGQIGLGIPAQADVLLSLLTTGGESIVDAHGHYNFESSGAVVAASVGHDVLSRGCGRVYEFLDAGIDQFGDSTLALLIASSLQEPEVVNRVLSGWNFPLGVMTLPPVSDTGGSLWRGPAVLPLSSDGSQHDAALEVAIWMLSPEAQAIWFEQTNYLPVRRSLAESWQADETLRASKRQLLAMTLTAAEQNGWSTWRPVTGQPECRAALVRSLFNLNTDQSVLDVLTTAQEACARAAEELP